MNLGPEIAKHAAALRDNPHFEMLRVELGRQAGRLMSQAIEATGDDLIRTASYARAVRDLFVNLQSMTTGVPDRVVKDDFAFQAPLLNPEAFDLEHPLSRGAPSRARQPKVPPASGLLDGAGILS